MRIFAFIFFCLLFASCVKPVELELPIYSNNLSVNCFFSPDQPFQVYVGKTGSMFDSLNVNIDNAEVSIYNGNILKGQLQHIGKGWYENPELFPEPGILYTLKANVAGYTEAFASDSVPSTFATFTYLGGQNDAWYVNDAGMTLSYFGFLFEIENLPGNHYFKVYYNAITVDYDKWDSIWVTDTIQEPLQCFDPVIKEEGSRYIFSDINFGNKPYQLQLLNSNIDFYLEYRDTVHSEIQVLQVSPAYFNYQIAYEKHKKGLNSDFLNPIEPVVMYSNVTNGYGIFAGYRSNKFPVNIEQNIQTIK
jgi:hypothetical protein